MIFPNVADAATLTASPAALAALPVSNLQKQTRGELWRSNATIENQHILGDLAGYQTVSALALVRHNLTSTASYRLRLYDGAGQSGTTLYDSGTVTLGGSLLGWGSFDWGTDPWGTDNLEDWPVPYLVAWFDPVLALSFDLELDDSANADGYLQAARLVLGNYFEPEKNMSYGLAMSWQEQSRQVRTEGGTLRTDERQAYRRFSFSLDWLTPAERATLLDKLRRAGLRNDLFLSCFPADTDADRERDYAGLVKLTEAPAMNASLPAVYRTSLVFEES